MNIIFWNIRGIGNNESRIALSELCRLIRPSFTFIVEPMVTRDSIPNWFWTSINVTQFCVNKRELLHPNLWPVWGPHVSFTVIFASSQCPVLEHVCKGTRIFIAGVYASMSYFLRRQL